MSYKQRRELAIDEFLLSVSKHLVNEMRKERRQQIDKKFREADN